ncbi:hypothetical protein EC973_009558 [Apophysomyces ossiformis]|uniref:Tc1-like transposase DDE domain-containing protein n=1 Tax=Apophysomyces ossiformis TaxID=679940 RepID=A0A8H7BR84_9FUNG|nr:hypothetical protein EC973_009558 [Apophysomyces ossiformis]
MELKEEHEDDEVSNGSDEEQNEVDVQSSESDLKEEKPLRDLTEKRKDDASNARRVYTQQDINKLIALLVEQKLEKISVARNSEETLKKRKETILQWLADKEMDFDNNCVFLDEAGFNLHMTRTRGWSKKGAPAKTTVPASKGTTITILGAISSAGLLQQQPKLEQEPSII